MDYSSWKNSLVFLEIVSHERILHQAVIDAYNPLSCEVIHTRFFSIFSLQVFDRVYDQHYYMLDTLRNAGQILDWAWSRPKGQINQSDEDQNKIMPLITNFDPSDLISIRSIIEEYTCEKIQEGEYDNIGWKRYFDEK